MKNIILVGIMGCGKTTISKLLSEKLKMPVIDMDKYIEKKYQCTIPDMFAISEEYFRDRESEACLDMAKLDGYIISTGGGVIKRKENSLTCHPLYLKRYRLILICPNPSEFTASFCVFFFII